PVSEIVQEVGGPQLGYSRRQRGEAGRSGTAGERESAVGRSAPVHVKAIEIPRRSPGAEPGVRRAGGRQIRAVEIGAYQGPQRGLLQPRREEVSRGAGE